jgi:hypothetical protein
MNISVLLSRIISGENGQPDVYEYINLSKGINENATTVLLLENSNA